MIEMYNSFDFINYLPIYYDKVIGDWKFRYERGNLYINPIEDEKEIISHELGIDKEKLSDLELKLRWK